MDTAEAQQAVAAAIAARGYRDGWTADAFQARQIAKLQEELGELAQTFKGPFSLIDVAGRQMKQYFDSPRGWSGVSCLDPEAARAELADVCVVALVLAEALGFDVVQAALDKAQKDVPRGVRQ